MLNLLFLNLGDCNLSHIGELRHVPFFWGVNDVCDVINPMETNVLDENIEFFAEIADQRGCIMDDHDWITELTLKPTKKKKAKSAQSIEVETSTKVTPEKLHTVNNLVPVSFLEKGVMIAQSVGKIRTPAGSGSGTLIGRNLMLTNNHVIDNADAAQASTVDFRFERDIHGVMRPIERRKIVDLIVTHEKLDYSVVQLEGNPGDEFGFVDITTPNTPTPGHPENGYPIIIQHPGGGEKMVAVTDNHVIGVQSPMFHYTTDTMGGTSGSLVFSHDWKPMGLHRAGRHLGPDASGRMRAQNEGVLLSAILANLQSQGLFSSQREIYARMRTLLQNPQSLPDPSGAPDVNWFYGSNLQSALVEEAKDDFEIAPLIAAAAGVAAGAGAAHWGHRTSKELIISGGCTMVLDFSEIVSEESAAPQFFIRQDTTPYAIFEMTYPEVRSALHLSVMRALVQKRREERPTDFEIAPLAGAFLAGVAAGASAYSAGK